MLYSIVLYYENRRQYCHLPLEKEEKMKLKAEMEAGILKRISCACDADIEYGISSDFKLYPKKSNQQHRKGCMLQPQSYELYKKYNSGFCQNLDDTVSINQDFSFLTSKQKYKDFKRSYSLKYPNSGTINGKISVSAMVKHLNMFVFAKLAQKGIYLRDMQEFSRKIFGYSNLLAFPNYHCTLNDFMTGNVENHKDVKFVYGRAKILWTHNCDNYQILVDDKTKISINKEDLESLFQDFQNVYKISFQRFHSCLANSKNLETEGFYLVFGGYIRKKPYKSSYYYEFLDGCFLLVNSYGLFVESTKEVVMYNYICDYLTRNHLEDIFEFHKPDFYEPTIYQNDYVGDGIIENRKTGEKFCVEVFGMQGIEAYEKKKEIKKEDLKNKLISWNPAKENLPDLRTWLN